MKKRFLAAISLLMTALPLLGQSFQEAMFLDSYRLAYRYNPALGSNGGFVGIGEWNNLTRNNIGASCFLYPTKNGGLVTALHHSVPESTFLGSLKDINRVENAININLFAYGWKSSGGDDAADPNAERHSYGICSDRGSATGAHNSGDYCTLEANIRTITRFAFPKTIFQILKSGTGLATYDASGIEMGAKAYVEIAYGRSRRISEDISIGGRAKVLAGIASLNYNITRFDLAFSESEYSAAIEAGFDLTDRSVKFGTDAEGYLNPFDLKMNNRTELPAGGGVAFDFGVAMTPAEGLTIAASIVDLGAIAWYYGNAGQSSGNVRFTGLSGLSYEEIKGGEISGSLKGLRDDFANSLKIKGTERRFRLEAIPFTLNLAARWELPFHRPLSAGLTCSYAGLTPFIYKECRMTLAWNPGARLGIAGNIGYGDLGMVGALALSIAIHKFNITASLENGFGRNVPDLDIPLKANSKLATIGLTYNLEIK